LELLAILIGALQLANAIVEEFVLFKKLALNPALSAQTLELVVEATVPGTKHDHPN
jgi:hypothetical protein